MKYLSPFKSAFSKMAVSYRGILWGMILMVGTGVMFTNALHAQHKAAEHYQTSPKPHFKPNKGQVADHEGNPISEFKYVYQAPGMKMGLKKNGFSYNLYTVEEKPKDAKKVSEATGKPVNPDHQPPKPGGEKKKQTTYHYHRVEVEFKGANENPEIIAEQQMDYYANYYLGYLPEHVTNVHGYQKLTYKNLYDSIDLVLTRKKGDKGQERLKYDIVVHPGGDLSQVKMAYKGMKDLSVEDENLQISTSQGQMTETIPASYWAGSEEAVTVNYQVDENVVRFKAKEKEKGQTLVVDPSLKWSSFLGGGADERGRGVVMDSNGNAFVSGKTESNNFPITSGAYQTSYGGGSLGDAFLSRFTSEGNLSWSTFLGGNGDDGAQGICIDGNGNSFVTGETESSNFPTTSSAYQNSYGSGYRDGFLSKFTSGGSLKWSTFLGSTNDDRGYGVTTDNNGNVFVTGRTGSSNFPTTNGAYQTSKGRQDDAFLSKFTNQGSLSWSTFLGSNNIDRGMDIATDSNGNAFVTGSTSSNNFPITSGAYQTSMGGSNDVFLSKFSSGGSLRWSTYIGDSDSEQGNEVSTDNGGNVFVTGSTKSSNFPTTNGAYQTSYGGGNADAFLSKFTNGGNLSWSTFIGGNYFEKGNGLATATNGNVFVTGWTGSSNFPTTSGAYQTSRGGSGDAFLSKFKSGGNLNWSTFLGDSKDERAKGVATDGNGNTSVTGWTNSRNFPTTAGAYQTSYNSGFNDAFITTFINCPKALTADFRSDNVCKGDSVQLMDNTIFNTGSINQYSWDLGDGDTASGKKISHFYSSTGDYSVELAITLDNGCKDTVTKNIEVNPFPAAEFTVNNTGQCQKRNSYQFTDQSSISSGSLNYDWDFGDGDTSDQQTPTHSYSSYGNYKSKLIVTSDKGCKDTAIDTMVVHPMPSPAFSYSEDSSQCLGDNQYSLTNNSTIAKGSQSYNWNFGDDSTSTKKSPKHSFNSSGTYPIQLVATSDSGCVDTTTRKVTVEPMPSADFSVNDTNQCLEGNNFQFTDQSSISSGTFSQNWYFGSGDTSQVANPGYQYNDIGQYRVKLILSSDKGCLDTAQQQVRLRPTPNSKFNYTKLDYETVSFEAVDTTLPVYDWDFGDGTTANGDSTAHVYSSSGSYEVSLMVENTAKCRDTSMDTVTMTSVGIDASHNGSNIPFKAYPNPFSQEVKVTYELPANNDVRLMVVDKSGNIIFNKYEAEQKAGFHTYQIRSLGKLTAGTYFIKLIIDGNQKVKKVMKVR